MFQNFIWAFLLDFLMRIFYLSIFFTLEMKL